MLKLLVVAALLLSLSAAAPVEHEVSPAFCKICKKVIDAFITGPNFMKNDKELADDICKKALDGPMVSVCAAGIIGEIDFIRDTFNDDPQAICERIGCPAKNH